MLIYLKYKGLSVKRFEESCSLSNGYVRSMRQGFGADKLVVVLATYSDLSRDWLLYGEGEMIKGADAAPPSDAQPPAAESGGDMVERIVQLLNDRDREIADLNRQIGRLEAQLEAAQKGAAHQGGNATVADVG